MAAYKMLDFQDIYESIAEELKVQLTDTNSINRIKRAVNMIYLNEVVPAARWNWLSGHSSVTHKAYYASGTVSVTPNSTTVTLSVAPASTVGESGSFLNYLFSVDGKNEVYRISAHTALSTTVTLDRNYNDDLDADASFKIWAEDLALPTDLREVIECWHDHSYSPMEGRGLKKFREVVSLGQKTEGRPSLYTLYDYRDPSTGTGETESDRYRLLKVFPSISSYATMIKLDYIKETAALDDDGDEPAMPLEDRIVLFYGALSLVWGSIARNPEEAARNRALFEAKLARMMGKLDSSTDKPRIEPESTYVSAKRGPRISGVSRRLGQGGGGQSTYNSPSYLAGVTINGATITGNVTVNASVTIDGRDLSVDGAALDAHIAASTGVHGVTGAVVGTTDSQTLTNKNIDADLNTITNIENADIKTGAAIARSKLASGTASVLLANDGSGVMSESTVTATEATYLANVEPLTSVTLTDNTAVATLVAQWAHASYTNITIEYSLSRGAGNRENGSIRLTTDGTTAGISNVAASIGTLGVTFTTDISGANVRLLYTTTNTGTNVSMKYKVQKWLA